MSNPVVVFETSHGSFDLELYPEKTPKTVENFLKYVSDKFYDGTIFHRIIDGFMIQGGGIDASGKPKATRAPIVNESGTVLNKTYSISMARTNDLNSATSQFFINVKDNDFLDKNRYCAFGMVISGTDTIDKIKAVAVRVGPGGENSTPVEPPEIKSVRLKTR